MSTSSPILENYRYGSADPEHTSAYLWEPILAQCRRLKARRILDLGCGSGSFCGALAEAGYEAVGCDPSSDGVRLAAQAYPTAAFQQRGVDDDPAPLGGNFDVVVSLEVVEHLVVPQRLPGFAMRALRPGGHLILSTPYHGYLKNLMLSLTDKWDDHLSPFWDGGHIKFWSRKTLTRLVEKEGFKVIQFIGAGRIPFLWKSMIVVAEKPLTA